MKKIILIVAAVINCFSNTLGMENPAKRFESQRHRLCKELNRLPRDSQKDFTAQKKELLIGTDVGAVDLQEAAQPRSLKPSLIARKDFASQMCDSACYTSNDLIVGLDSEVIVFDAHDFNKQKLKFSLLAVHTIAASLDNSEFATSSRSISRWDLATGKLLAELAKQSAYDLQYDRESKRMLVPVVSTGECEVWDLASNTKIQTLPAALGVTSAQWNPADNNQVASCSGDILSICDLRQNKLLHSTNAQVPLYELNYTNDGTIIVAGGQKQFVTFSGSNAALRYYRNLHGQVTKDNKPLPVSGNSVDVLRLKMRPNTHSDFVIASLNNQTNAIVGFDLHDTENRFYLEKAASTAIVALDVNPDGNSMVTGGFQDTEIKIWNIAPDFKSDSVALGKAAAPEKKSWQCKLQ